jgi:hypothetical protein
MLEMVLFAMIQWGVLTAMIARAKHRDVAAWFGIGAALPVFGLVAAIIVDVKPRTAKTTQRKRASVAHATVPLAA